MSQKRKLFFRIATLSLIALLIYHAWFERSNNGERLSEARLAGDVRPLSFEEHILEIQAKLILGAKRFAQDMGGKDEKKEHEVAERLDPVISQAFAQSLREQQAGTPLLSSPEAKRYVMRKRLIIASYLDLQDLKKDLTETVTKQSALSSHEEKRLDGLLLRVIQPPAPDAEPLTPDDFEFLKTELGWFGQLVRLTSDKGVERDLLEDEVFSPAVKSFRKFIAGIGVAAVLIILSVVLFAWFLITAFSRRIQFQLQVPGEISEWGLEIFCLYLTAMFALPHVFDLIKKFGFDASPLILNSVFITGLAVIIVWPRLFGVPFRQVTSFLGLYLKGATATVKDFLLGPTAYIASWVVMFTVLILYSILIRALGVDISQGAHPIVPVLLGSDDKRMYSLIALLAVVVAPFIEEIMFRGALYGWLRGRMSATASIIISALLFAAVHPQGPLGLVPLASIGMILALLREWRGNLIAPMLTHACFNGGTLTMIFLFMK